MFGNILYREDKTTSYREMVPTSHVTSYQDLQNQHNVLRTEQDAVFVVSLELCLVYSVARVVRDG